MCGRFVLIEDHTGVYSRFFYWKEFSREVWKQLFEEGRVLEVKRNFHIRPTNQVPVITNRDGERELEVMRWGFTPAWYNPDDPKHGRLKDIINARDDGLSSATWRGAIKSRRCLIPASGFYEWPVRGGQPAYIHPPDGRLIAFAGLYETWTDKFTGESTTGCSIITTEPNDFMRPLHWNPERKRMPVVLQSTEAETLWLDPMTNDVDGLKQFFGPIPWDGWTYHMVNKLPNDGADNPKLLDPAEQQARLM